MRRTQCSTLRPIMSEATDPINYLLTGGGLSGGAVGGFLLSRIIGNGKSSSQDAMSDQLEAILAAQQQTNVLLAELKGILSSRP